MTVDSSVMKPSWSETRDVVAARAGLRCAPVYPWGQLGNLWAFFSDPRKFATFKAAYDRKDQSVLDLLRSFGLQLREGRGRESSAMTLTLEAEPDASRAPGRAAALRPLC